MKKNLGAQIISFFTRQGFAARAVQKIAQEIDVTRPVVVVDFFVGTGKVAQEIARRISPTSRMLLVASSVEHAQVLRRMFVGDERVEVCVGTPHNAEELLAQHSMEGANSVLAEEEALTASEEELQALMHAAERITKPGGVLVIPTLLGAQKAQEWLRKGEEKVMWNHLPPLCVLVSKKEG